MSLAAVETHPAVFQVPFAGAPAAASVCASYGDDVLYPVSGGFVAASAMIDVTSTHRTDYYSELGSGCSLLFRNRSRQPLGVSFLDSPTEMPIIEIGADQGRTWTAGPSGMYRWYTVDHPEVRGDVLVR